MTTPSESIPLIDQVQSMLSELGWEPSTQEDGCLYYPYKGETGSWTARVLVEDTPDEVSFWVMANVPVIIPEARRRELADFLMRINPQFSPGHFILLMESGEIVYAAGIELMDGKPTTRMLERYFHAALRIMDEFLPHFLTLAYGTETAKALYQQIFPKTPETGETDGSATMPAETVGTLQ